MSSTDELKARFLEFRKKRYALPLGLVLALAVGSVLTYFLGAVCFGALLIAIVGFYVPKYFGLTSKSKLAVWGLVFILVLSIPFTWASAVGSVNSFDGYPLESANGVLVGGHVTPFRGEAGTPHTFNVTLTSDAPDAAVNVIVTDQTTFRELGNYSLAPTGAVVGGTNYALTTDAAAGSLYSYRFVTNATGPWISTVEGYGPVHWSDLDIFQYFLPYMALALLLQVGMLFYLLLLFSWFTDRSKARMGEVMKQREQAQRPAPADVKVEKFVCSECGADVPADAGRCPQCGESFDEESAPKAGKAQFECSECGANVDAGAMTCWNCGKEFEN
jgi:ribosomal protein L40E